jgi:hypothetical protein
VKKVVDAFAGHWTLTGKDHEPGTTAPAAVSATMDCKAAALNVAVTWRIAADVSGTRIEAATVIGTGCGRSTVWEISIGQRNTSIAPRGNTEAMRRAGWILLYPIPVACVLGGPPLSDSLTESD